MAAIQSANQSPRVTQQYLNTATYTGDPSPGTVVSTANVSGSIVQPYSGMLGGFLALNEADAARLSDAASRPLRAGLYQYVKFYLSSSGSNAAGQIVYWQDYVNYVVTPDAASTVLRAGITLGAPTKGNYWFIQVQGVAAVKFNSSLTNGSPAIGDAIKQVDATHNVADDPTQSTALTYALEQLILGDAVEAPAVSVLKLVRLRPLLANF